MRELSTLRVDQSARCPVRELVIRELAYLRVVQLPLAAPRITLWMTAKEVNSTVQVHVVVTQPVCVCCNVNVLSSLCRDASLRNSVERIFTVWRERNVFEDEFLDQLLTALCKLSGSFLSQSCVRVFFPH